MQMVKSEAELHFRNGELREGTVEANLITFDEAVLLNGCTVYVDAVMVTDGNGWSEELVFNTRAETTAFFKGMKAMKDLLVAAPEVAPKDVPIPEVSPEEHPPRMK